MILALIVAFVVLFPFSYKYKNIAGSNGGALYCANGLGNSSKVLFENNISTGGAGGALYISGGEDITLGQFIFKDNLSQGVNDSAVGGALYVRSSQLHFENSLFYGNRAVGHGSAIYCADASLSMFNCTVTENVQLG